MIRNKTPPPGVRGDDIIRGEYPLILGEAPGCCLGDAIGNLLRTDCG